MTRLQLVAVTWSAAVFAFPASSQAQPEPARPAPAQVPAEPAPPPAAAPPAPAAPAAVAPAEPAPPLAPVQPAAAPLAPVAPAPPPTPASGPGAPVVAGELPGSFKIPGTETSLKLYAHVHIDTTFDIKGRVEDYNNNDWSTNVFVQPLDDTQDTGARKEGQFFLTARSSRFGLVTNTPTGIGTLVAKLEGDFNGPNSFQSELVTNSTLFRLRHAYGELAGLLVGQTWTNFTDLDSFPDTVDFNPPGDVVLMRQAMIRYALPLGPASLRVAVENSRSLTLGPSAVPPTGPDDPGTPGFEGSQRWFQVPDVTLNVTVPWSSGHVSARGVTMQYKALDNKSKQAWGAALSGSLKFLGDTLVWGAQGGDGIGRYTFNAILQGGYSTGSEIRLWKSIGYHAGFTHNWTPQLRSNLVWSQTFFKKDDEILTIPGGSPTLFNKRVDQAFVNTFWGFAKNCEVGLEYAYGQRRTFDDDKGTQHRINATFHYILL